MDEINRLIKDLLRLLQHIAEEDCETLERMDLREIKQELGSWCIVGYPLYQDAWHSDTTRSF